MATWFKEEGVTLALPSPAPLALKTGAVKYLDTFEERLKYIDEVSEACRKGDFNQLKLILERVKAEGKSCDPLLNLKFKVQATPLHEASGCGSVDCISLLLENGADTNVFDSLGFAPIHSAACNNHHQAIKTLLDHQPRNPNFTSRCSVDQPTDSGETPLQLACRLGHVETAEFLLGCGASVEGVDQRKNCLLHCVSASDSTVLWSWAINALKPYLTSMLNQGNQDGETPAHVAASGGCSTSVSALRELNADFGIKDRRDISAMDTMHVHGNMLCFAIATGQHPVMVIPPSPIPARALSVSSTNSPKTHRRSSMTGRNRPLTIPIPPPSASSSYQDLRSSTRRDSVRSVHSQISSIDLYFSKESLGRVSSHLSSVSSDERVQAVLDTGIYNPPQDLTVVEPVYRESITPKQSSIYCREHGIKFSSRYFIKDTSKSNREASIKPKEASVEAEEEIPVCIAAAMHLNISYSPNYVIISPVCFVSCRCEKAFRATLELPHAADLTEDNQEDKKHMCILHYVITNLSSSGLKSPSPMVRVLDRLNVESLEIENRCVRFKTSFKNPSLYAVGARSSGTTVPRPLVKLRCALFCMFQKFEKREVISIVTVRLFVGLSLQTVTQIIREEAKSSNSNFEDVLFTMRGGGIELQSTLNNTDGHWTLESNTPHKLTYNQIALTEESTKYFTYSHDLNYPPYKLVQVLPRGEGHAYLKFPVLFKAIIRDAGSNCKIAQVNFVPFAPINAFDQSKDVSERDFRLTESTSPQQSAGTLSSTLIPQRCSAIAGILFIPERVKLPVPSVINSQEDLTDDKSQQELFASERLCARYPGIHLSKDLIREAITADGGTIQTKDFGIIITIPKGALLETEKEAELLVCEVTGHFQFPPDCKPVSSAYLVEPNKKVYLRHGVTVKIWHTASAEMHKNLMFMSASPPPVFEGSNPVYVFRKISISKGVFKFGSPYGEITLDHYCIINIVNNNISTPETTTALGIAQRQSESLWNLPINVVTNQPYRSSQNVNHVDESHEQLPTARLTMDHHFKVTQQLHNLSRVELVRLGEALGLNYPHLTRMDPLLGEMVAAWLNGEDNVNLPSWSNLVKALNSIGLKGIAKVNH